MSVDGCSEAPVSDRRSSLPSCGVSSAAPSFFPSSSSCLYFRRFFLSALAAFFLLMLATCAVRLWSPLKCSSIRWARISRAILRFWSRERVACDLTTMPVGMCFSWTAEFVLFYAGGLVTLQPISRGTRWSRRGVRSSDLPDLSL